MWIYKPPPAIVRIWLERRRHLHLVSLASWRTILPVPAENGPSVAGSSSHWGLQSSVHSWEARLTVVLPSTELKVWKGLDSNRLKTLQRLLSRFDPETLCESLRSSTATDKCDAIFRKLAKITWHKYSFVPVKKLHFFSFRVARATCETVYTWSTRSTCSAAEQRKTTIS